MVHTLSQGEKGISEDDDDGDDHDGDADDDDGGDNDGDDNDHGQDDDNDCHGQHPLFVIYT